MKMKHRKSVWRKQDLKRSGVGMKVMSVYSSCISMNIGT
jgi:hypothetical protein